jgi:hypothetical protein
MAMIPLAAEGALELAGVSIPAGITGPQALLGSVVIGTTAAGIRWVADKGIQLFHDSGEWLDHVAHAYKEYEQGKQIALDIQKNGQQIIATAQTIKGHLDATGKSISELDISKTIDNLNQIQAVAKPLIIPTGSANSMLLIPPRNGNNAMNMMPAKSNELNHNPNPVVGDAILHPQKFTKQAIAATTPVSMSNNTSQLVRSSIQPIAQPTRIEPVVASSVPVNTPAAPLPVASLEITNNAKPVIPPSDL